MHWFALYAFHFTLSNLVNWREQTKEIRQTNMQIGCCKLHTWWERGIDGSQTERHKASLFSHFLLFSNLFLNQLSQFVMFLLFVPLFSPTSTKKIVKISFSFLCLRRQYLQPCSCVLAAQWWMWRALLRGVFFNPLLLTKTFQLASHCLSNLRIALVKCYLW